MSTIKKMPLWLAVLVNINIIVGGAFLLGAPKLAATAGWYAPWLWVGVGFLFLPLCWIFKQLSAKFPFAGGMYVYAQHSLGSFWGAICGSAYFLGTAAGNAAVLHMFAKQLVVFDIVPTVLARADYLALDLVLITLFYVVSVQGLNFFSQAQIFFTVLKCVPLLLTAVAFIFYGKASAAATQVVHHNWFWDAMPLVIFGYLGIEACCAIAHEIENGEKNTGRAIFIAMACIMACYAFMQFSLQACLSGTNFLNFDFVNLIDLFPVCATSNAILKKILGISMAFSFLGGAYSMFYANNWNLYALSHDLTQGSGKRFGFFTRLNEFGEPSGSHLLQTLVIALIFMFLGSDLVISASDFGVIIAYFCSILAFMHFFQESQIIGWLSFLAVGLLTYFVVHSAQLIVLALVFFAVIFGMYFLLRALQRQV